MSLHSVWRFITDFGDTAVTIPLAVLMTAFLLAAKQWRLALGWAATITICAGVVGGLKIVLGTCFHAFAGMGLSSPSGHTAMSTAVYGGFAAVLGNNLPPRSRSVVTVGAAALLIAIGVSRAVLGFHSKIEVAIGLCVGLATLAAIVFLVRRHPPGRLSLAGLVAGTIVIALLFHGDRWPAERAIRRLAAFLSFLHPWCS